MIPSLLTSLFYSPYIKSCQASNCTIALEIYCRNKRCGYINISKERITSLVSFGIKSFKGSAKREDIYFRYDSRKLMAVNRASNKTILKVKCGEEMCKSIKDELRTLNYTF